MYDVIVVGARCAGSPAAMLLSQKGYRVLLIDRAKLPSDKPLSTHYLLPNAIAALKRFGLLEKLKSNNCPPLKETLIDWGSNRFISKSPPVEGIGEGYCPRRYVLDEILFEGALSSGVEFREQAILTDLIFENDKVVGIKYQDSKTNKTHEERAKIVVGADGVFSQVAKLVKAKKYNEFPTQSAVCFSYWKDVPIEAGITVYIRPNRFLIMGRTNDGLTVMQVFVPVPQFKRFRQDLEGNFMNDFQEWVPEIYEKMLSGERMSNFLATAHQPNFFRTPIGEGWALVGDAALHHDSSNPTGITYAFVNTEKMVHEIDELLSGKIDYKKALVRFEDWREKRWLNHYHFLVEGSKPTPAPDPNMADLFDLMSRNSNVAYQFMGLFSGNEGYENFLSQDNLEKIFSEDSSYKAPSHQDLELTHLPA